MYYCMDILIKSETASNEMKKRLLGFFITNFSEFLLQIPLAFLLQIASRLLQIPLAFLLQIASNSLQIALALLQIALNLLRCVSITNYVFYSQLRQCTPNI